MSFGEQLRRRREELGMSRDTLAEKLGVSRSAIGNYETGVSTPKEDVLLRLFDALQVDPNYLYRDTFRHTFVYSDEERRMVEKYRGLPLPGRQMVHAVLDGLAEMQEAWQQEAPSDSVRTIPLYASPAAAGVSAPGLQEGDDQIPLPRAGPAGAAGWCSGTVLLSCPWITDGSVVYVNHDPLQNGDVGIFCVDGDMLCKQYYRDPLGMVYLFSLNRKRADMDVVFHRGSGRSLTCFGRVMMHGLPLPE